MISVFNLPIVFYPETRKTFYSKLTSQGVEIKFPERLLIRKKYLVKLIDDVYWKQLIKIATPQLQARTTTLNDHFFGFSFHKVRYHRQYRRLGSCSTLKNINISHRLIGGPDELVDYVIIHELAHLKYLNHGRDFWNLVRNAGQDPRIVRKETKSYAYEWSTNYQDWYFKLSNSVSEIKVSS